MSHENAEAVRRAYAAWNSDDLDGFLAELHTEIEWRGGIEAALGGAESTYRGHDGVRKGWAEYRGESFGRLMIRADEVLELGERVLVLGQMKVIGGTTGLAFDQEIGQLFDFRDGKVVRVRDFLSHAETLEAAGLAK